MNCNVCGHPKEKHLKNETNRASVHFCDACANIYLATNPSKDVDYLWHNFEDNLSYIERIAKAKGLV